MKYENLYTYQRQFKRKTKPLFYNETESDPQKVAVVERFSKAKKLSYTENIIYRLLKEALPDIEILPQYMIDTGTDRVFIVDFYIPSINLVIEVDGVYHKINRTYDFVREICLQANGYKVKRITCNEFNQFKKKHLIRFVREISSIYKKTLLSRKDNDLSLKGTKDG